MQSSDRIFNDYDKNIVFRDCQMHFLNINLRKKGDPFDFFHHFVELPAKNQTVIGLLLRH